MSFTVCPHCGREHEFLVDIPVTNTSQVIYCLQCGKEFEVVEIFKK